MVESDCCCLGRMRPLNFARPGRYEACVVTQASLYAAVLFWLVSLWSIVSNLAGTMSIIEVAFEALLDFISTAVVLYRLSETDALHHTPYNQVLEQRTSIVLGMTMVVLGASLIAGAARSLSEGQVGDSNGSSVLSMEAILGLPSALIYLVIGMMQLQMSWILDLRSLKQDAIISILGAIISVGALAAALANIILCARTEPLAPLLPRTHTP